MCTHTAISMLILQLLGPYMRAYSRRAEGLAEVEGQLWQLSARVIDGSTLHMTSFYEVLGMKSDLLVLLPGPERLSDRTDLTPIRDLLYQSDEAFSTRSMPLPFPLDQPSITCLKPYN